MAAIALEVGHLKLVQAASLRFVAARHTAELVTHQQHEAVRLAQQTQRTTRILHMPIRTCTLCRQAPAPTVQVCD